MTMQWASVRGHWLAHLLDSAGGFYCGVKTPDQSQLYVFRNTPSSHVELCRDCLQYKIQDTE